MVRNNPPTDRRLPFPQPGLTNTSNDSAITNAIQRHSGLNTLQKAMKHRQEIREANELLLKDALARQSPEVDQAKLAAIAQLLREYDPELQKTKGDATARLADAVNAGAFSGPAWTAWRTLVAANPTIENAFRRLVESSPAGKPGDKFDGPERWITRPEMKFLATCINRFAEVIEKANSACKSFDNTASINRVTLSKRQRSLLRGLDRENTYMTTTLIGEAANPKVSRGTALNHIKKLFLLGLVERYPKNDELYCISAAGRDSLRAGKK